MIFVNPLRKFIIFIDITSWHSVQNFTYQYFFISFSIFLTFLYFLYQFPPATANVLFEDFVYENYLNIRLVYINGLASKMSARYFSIFQVFTFPNNMLLKPPRRYVRSNFIFSIRVFYYIFVGITGNEIENTFPLNYNKFVIAYPLKISYSNLSLPLKTCLNSFLILQTKADLSVSFVLQYPFISLFISLFTLVS